jgi:hypothetical protein
MSARGGALCRRVRVGSLDVRLGQRPLPDNDGYEFLWCGDVVGRLRWNDGRDNAEAGWWLEPVRGEPRLVWRSSSDADLGRERVEHEPAARWFAQAMLASEIAGHTGPARTSDLSRVRREEDDESGPERKR